MTFRSTAILFFLFCFCFANAQKLQSPDEFLGYPLGKKFTAHHNIVRYFESAAAASPQMMKLQPYGETNEGRPLMIAVIATPENFSRIEEIRKNNLRLTGLMDDEPGNVNAPAIVWLSYNVHGNEPSSSEVSMKMLYELLSGKNTQLNEWLKNTVVIIDPCLNPDGRERYVNWFRQMSGAFPNADPNSREHDEPWPGGRVNHYNFDLNRDWAWQTQKESQERVAVYQQWMPQIHCDFHEQYPGSPYFFPPAAEPQHEALTQWQRDYQVTAGKNNAKYFDQKGWLYFTKQYFDLFYPSYGDTYPLFNGAIGMTYEQAGHSVGGLAYAEDNGDTLTLTDRIAHHFSTSLSTVEAASTNAKALLSNFKKYFDDSRAGINNPVKNYIVAAHESELTGLKELLRKNDISYGYPNESKVIKAFSYFSGKEENFKVEEMNLLIPANQPKAVLLKVLFEPQPKLSDSSTYDITAWAVPYAYGLSSFSTKEIIKYTKDDGATSIPVPHNSDAYGYLVKIENFQDIKLLSALLNMGLKLRFTETSIIYKGITYSPGSMIILQKGNENKIPEAMEVISKLNGNSYALNSGFMDNGVDFGSDKIHFMRKPNVALLTGEGASANAAGEVWHLFEKQLEMPVTLLNNESIGDISLKNYNVIIIPDGRYKFLRTKDAADDLKQWVNNGGKLIVMENAARQIASLDWGLKIKKDDDGKDAKADTNITYGYIRKYANRDRESVVNNIPGAIYKLQLDNTHPVGFGYPDFYYTLKQNETVYEFLKEGWNIGVIKKQKPVSGFVGSNIKSKISDGVLIGEIPMGRGSVVFFADDPLFRSFWENGKELFCNAVFYSN